MAAKEEEFVYRSKLPDISIPNHLPLHTYCFERMAEVKERACIIEGSTGKVYHYEQVKSISTWVGAGLARLGVGRGDVIMILLPNCPEFVFTFLGASFIGAITTPANPHYTPGEIAKQAHASGAKLVITRATYVEKLNNVNQHLIIVTLEDPAPQGCVAFSVLLEQQACEMGFEVGPEEVVALPFSSGTTGLPKGVMLTHSALVSTVAQQVDGENTNVHLRPDDVMLCLLPLFHIYSLNMLLCSLRSGASVLIVEKFEMCTLLRLIQSFKVSFAPLVPPLVLAMAKNPAVEKYDLSSLRMLMSGAAPLGKDLEEALQAKIPNATIAQGYGMTEAGPVIAMSLAFAKEPFPIKSGSGGTVVRNAQIKIIDLSTGLSLPHGQSGEICIRGPQLMKGYLNNPEATAKTIDKNGWLHTGDIGYIDDDEELFIVDRVKELIKYKAFQVAPAELEAILVKHPFIADVAVVAQKDEAVGELPVAFVVISGNHEITAEEIKQFVAKEVVFYKKLHHVYFVDSIPKSQSGKILRNQMQSKFPSG
ncbi:hypothetical protein SUGI_0530580 [Cryptomeria japonica]|uniref:4-coumarate--CoA ligase n=1 Tax=Cryptomeria japonica TaxID=3369 RepID=UPI002408AAFC|nr:4-coumarate--CoA ligase [Cryptomeria japonica]GLJ27063.1 hypothetical protein SUGI_0530580 [Cryptomeria japonica]